MPPGQGLPEARGKKGPTLVLLANTVIEDCNDDLQLFLVYEYAAEGRPRLGLSLGLFVDCLNTFSVPGHNSIIEILYPGPDMQLLLK